MQESGSEPTTIHFIRHGENPANIRREFSCRKVDYPLTERGIEQARQTAAHLATRPIAAVYASPLKRAAQTAEIVAEPLGLPVVIREAFREVDVGLFEGQPPTDEIWARHDAIFEAWARGDAAARFPEGESQIELIARMRTGMREIVLRHPGREVAVVAHGGILWATACEICPTMRYEDLTDIPNCAITELAVWCEDGELHGDLRGWATCVHLT